MLCTKPFKKNLKGKNILLMAQAFVINFQPDIDFRAVLTFPKPDLS